MVERRKYLRFSLAYRFEHWVMAVNFIMLAITGLVQMFASSPVSQWIVWAFGGIENVRKVHHFCAVILIVEILFHIGLIRYRAYIRLSPRRIMPSLYDINIAIQAFLYNLGFAKERPKEGRYTFAEKAEYWAVVWGTVIMVITGFMMWNPIATTRYLPGEFIPTAKAAHGAEAVLAVLAIIVWHFYFVLFRSMNMSMYTGYLTEKGMRAEHPLELEDIRAGRTVALIDPDAVTRYWRFCFPQYVFICGMILIAMYYFVTFEATAITNVVRAEDVNIFSPLSPSVSVQLPAIGGGEGIEDFETAIVPTEYTWESGISEILSTTCGGCHGASASGGLNLTDYQAVMDSGVIVPGDPDGSRLISMVASGDHYARLTEENLEKVRAWIQGGAPRNGEEGEAEELEKAEEEAAAEFTPPDLTWASGIAGILSASCGTCHGASAAGGLNVTDYDALMDAGVVVPRNPGSSRLIQKIEGGTHFGRLSAENLATVRRWIENGAPRGAPAPEPAEPEQPQEEPVTPEQPSEQPEEPEAVETEGEGPLYYWDADIQSIFESRCTACHGAARVGGFDFRTFQSLMESGLIVAGDPDNSRLVRKIEIENHPGTLTPEEISEIRAWISHGALESETGTSEVPPEETEEAPPQEPADEEPATEVPETVESAYTWDADIQAMLGATCAGCHGTNATAGLNLTTYATMMDADVVVPGDPDSSLLVTKIKDGTHFARLTAEQLEILVRWILAGAPES